MLPDLTARGAHSEKSMSVQLLSKGAESMRHTGPFALLAAKELANANSNQDENRDFAYLETG